jgi:signal transduction histidine kinase
VLNGIDECTAVTCSAVEQVRGLAINLRPPHLDDLGLEATIAWLVDQQSGIPGLSRTFRAGGVPRFLPSCIEIACFRVAEEALMNVVKHASATEVTVRLYCEAGVLRLDIHDNGIGFDIEAARSRATAGASVGLLSMRERAAVAGGRITLRRVPAGGTRISALFPLRGLGLHEVSGQP